MNEKAVITIAVIGGTLYLMRNSGGAAAGEDGGWFSGGGGGGGFADPLAGGDPNDPGSVPSDGATGDYTGPDSDGDGVPDVYDVFPNDPSRTGYEQPDTSPQDADGDGVQDAYDPFPNDGSRGADTYDMSAQSYPEPSFLETPLGQGVLWGGIAAASIIGPPLVSKLMKPKLLDFSTRSPRTQGLRSTPPRSAPRTPLRSVPAGRPAAPAPRSMVTTARSGVATPLPPRSPVVARVAAAAPRVASPTPSGPIRLSTARVPGAPAAGGLRVIPGAPPVSNISRIAAPIARVAASPAVQTTARVASRAATVATVATGGYVAARNVVDTVRAAATIFDGGRSQADIDRAKQLSGGAVARGTEFLSLGVVSINPNSGTRILNQNFSYATAENFGKGVQSIKSGGKDKNRWTFWK